MARDEFTVKYIKQIIQSDLRNEDEKLVVDL
jgi:hypothetical protein